MLACNVYIFSKMSYILQCARLPSTIGKTMLQITAKLFQGPGMWITPDFLNDLSSVGSPFELVNPHAYSMAIASRVILKAGFDIQKVITEYLITGRRWAVGRAGNCPIFDEWFADSFGHNLSSANNFASRAAVDIQLTNPSWKNSSEMKHLQQLLATRAKPLFVDPNYINTFLRRRMRPWECYATPNLIAARISSNLRFASNEVRPAVAFAYLHLVLNGMTTYQTMHNLPGFVGEDICSLVA